ncbi:MAG: hypothetical protein DDT29_02239 [Dehalococcoidia bacterium]|nr:hypothetical protein [Bacillota bacterium]
MAGVKHQDRYLSHPGFRVHPLSYPLEAVLDQLPGDLLGLLKSTLHLIMNLVDGTAANRVVGVILQQELPGLLEESTGVILAPSPLNHRERLGIPLQKGLCFGIHLFQIGPRR